MPKPCSCSCGVRSRYGSDHAEQHRDEKRTPELKDVFDYDKRDKRMEALKDAFTVQPAQTSGKNLLLFDDLYRSGATVSAITELLKSQGKAKAVYLLTLTETRRTA
jgi:predicted amidophosphoribosyltransferase